MAILELIPCDLESQCLSSTQEQKQMPLLKTIGRFCDASLSATTLLLKTQAFYSMLTAFRTFQSKPDLNC